MKPRKQSSANSPTLSAAATQAGVILGTILAAQRAYAETGAFPELLSIYHLLGDPALKIN